VSGLLGVITHRAATVERTCGVPVKSLPAMPTPLHRSLREPCDFADAARSAGELELRLPPQVVAGLVSASWHQQSRYVVIMSWLTAHLVDVRSD
jgi:hypothetical protein